MATCIAVVDFPEPPFSLPKTIIFAIFFSGAIDFLFKSFEIYKINSGIPNISLVGLGIEAAGAMFYTGGLIMLPVVGALLLTNIAVGIITRSAPQLNMFSFAFPVTMLLAFLVLYLSSQSMGNAFAELTKSSLESIENALLGK